MARMTKTQKRRLARDMDAKAAKLFIKGLITAPELMQIQKIAKKALREADKNYPLR